MMKMMGNGMGTADILKTMYNQILADKGVWQGYVTNAMNAQTALIAQSRVDAYCDILNIITAQLTTLGYC